MEYKKRVVDQILEKKLQSKGIVLVQGAKWCGKTTTSAQKAKSVVYMQDPNYRNLAELDISKILEGETPHLIDEWQLYPELWDALRFEADKRSEPGQFIITGSATPTDSDKIHHSGIGRITKLLMRPMSLFESEESNGKASLRSLFDGDDIYAENDLSLDNIAYILARGGWPASIGKEEDIALEDAKDYLEVLVDSDLSFSGGIKRNPMRLRTLLRSYSRNIASQASIETIKRDIESNSTISISDETIASYINALERIFLIEDSQAFNPNLRSKTAIRTSKTRYFTDPSIALAALNISYKDLIKDLKTFGLLFENLVLRDLRIYTNLIGGTVLHYRDKNNLECNAVVHLNDGRYGLCEIKLGGDSLIEEAVKTLSKLSKKIAESSIPQPSFIACITAVGKFAYKRKDGIYVLPIGCLGV